MNLFSIPCCRIKFLMFIGFAFASSSLVAQVDSTWDGSTGVWSESFRWSSADFPNNGNGGNDYNVFFGGGAATLDQAITIDQLNMSGGTLLGGTFDLNVLDTFVWDAGIVDGATIQANGGVNFSSGNVVLRNGAIVNSSGISNWSNGTLQNGGGSVFNNLAGGFFNVTGDNQFNNGFGGAASTFNNQGTFTKAAGSGVTLFSNSTNFNNSGVVNVSSGTLRLSDGVSSGDWNANGGTIDFNRGTHDLNAGTVSGSGTVEFSGGTTNFNAGTYDVAGTTRLSGGRLNLNNNASTGELNFTSSGGAIGGTSTLTVNGLLTWDVGILDGATIQANGGMDISLSNVSIRNGSTVNNSGIANWSNGAIQNGGGATFNNQLGGVFNVTGDNQFNNGFGGAVSSFNNQGTFTKSAGNGVTLFSNSTNFNNSGVVNVLSGSLRLSEGVSTGDWNANGGTIDFNRGTHDLNGGTISGSGTVEFSGGTTNFNAGTYDVAGTTRFNGGRLNLNNDASTGGLEFTSSGGTIGGTSTMTANGLLTWDSGIINGATIQANGGMQISLSNVSISNGGTVNNSGIANWSNGAIQNGGGAVFNNQVGGVFNVTGDNQFNNGFGGAVSSFNNQGTFTKSVGTGVTNFANSTNFNNSGVVNVSSGTLRLSDGVSTGDWNANGGTIDFNRGTHDLNAGTTSGLGTVEFSGGTTNFNGGTFNVSGMTRINGGQFNVNRDALTEQLEFTQSGGTIGGTNTLTTNGLLTWNSGALDGATIQANGGMEMASGNVSIRNGGIVNNSGVANWSNGNIQMGSNAEFRNQLSGVVNASGDNQFNNGFGGAESSFINEGEFIKTGGNGTTQFANGIRFLNSGLVSVQTGSLEFRNFSQSAGAIELAGGDIIATSNDLSIMGGALIGDGDVFGNVDVVAGTIAPGFSAGELRIDGDLDLGDSSVLLMELGGFDQSTEYDFLSITGAVTLDGELSLELIDGFESIIQTGDLFTLVSSSNLTGSFNNVSSGGTVDVAGIGFEVFYGAGSQFGVNDVVVRSTVGVPEPAQAGLLVLFSLAALRRRSRV